MLIMLGSSSRLSSYPLGSNDHNLHMSFHFRTSGYAHRHTHNISFAVWLLSSLLLSRHGKILLRKRSCCVVCIENQAWHWDWSQLLKRIRSVGIFSNQI